MNDNISIEIKNYHKEENEELERFKVKLLKIIAQSELKYVDLHRLAYDLDKLVIGIKD